ncbi:MAG: DegV family protein [Anaerolineae bacterium]|nr:DegV family protein [Anaerolineae bacterium]
MIKIVTDSTHYLPPDLMAQYDIRVAPIQLFFRNEVFQEGVDMDPETFWARLAVSAVFPTTAQPRQQAFWDTWRSLLDDGHEIVTLLLSGKISGAVDTARSLLSQLPGAPISLIDSRSTAMGLGFQVLRAAELAEQGGSRADIVSAVDQMQIGIQILLVPDSLENLRRGGRINSAKAWAGTLLNIKPLLSFSKGFIEPIEQIRTTKRAQARMLELTRTFLDDDLHPWIAVMHSRSPEQGQALLAELRGHYPGARFFFSEIGPTLGVHLGIGGTGIIVCRSDVL